MIEETIKEIIKDTLEEHVPALVRQAVAKQMGPKMLTTSQVEEQYGIDRQKQYRLRQQGKLTYVQDGKVITYPIDTIESYCEQHTVRGKH